MAQARKTDIKAFKPKATDDDPVILIKALTTRLDDLDDEADRLERIASETEKPTNIADRLSAIKRAMKIRREVIAKTGNLRQVLVLAGGGPLPDDPEKKQLVEKAKKRFRVISGHLEKEQKNERRLLEADTLILNALEIDFNPVGGGGDFSSDENNSSHYDNGTMNDLNKVAYALGYTSFEQAKRVLERGAPNNRARGDNTPRTNPKPRALWDSRKGADAKLSPPEFIAKHYAAEMAAGTLHRGVIAQYDKPLAVKLANWLRTHPMPEGIDIPTLPEWNTRQLGKLKGEAERDVLRLYEVARKRKSKQAAHTPA